MPPRTSIAVLATGYLAILFLTFAVGGFGIQTAALWGDAIGGVFSIVAIVFAGFALVYQRQELEQLKDEFTVQNDLKRRELQVVHVPAFDATPEKGYDTGRGCFVRLIIRNHKSIPLRVDLSFGEDRATFDPDRGFDQAQISINTSIAPLHLIATEIEPLSTADVGGIYVDPERLPPPGEFANEELESLLVIGSTPQIEGTRTRRVRLFEMVSASGYRDP